MPFWWKRRRRPWFGRWRYKRRKTYRRRRKRFPRRRRYRKPTRRRRRRKVRRKLQKITIKQWQPDSIKKCKIKGFSCLVLGAQGRQYCCYTNETNNWLQPKAPGGGGFGCELITLKWLYNEYMAHNNIWTTSNQYLELCRYTGCKITIYRHPTVDFIFFYERQPPFDLDKYTYMEIHPQNIMLRRKKKILLSKRNHPNGKNYITVKIKPPKQMVTKWFFQQDFQKYGLVKICAAAADFSYSRIASNGQSTILTMFALDTNYYSNSNWAKSASTPYCPHGTTSTTYYKYPTKSGQWSTPQEQTYETTEKGYNESISWEKGQFKKEIMCGKVYVNKTCTTLSGSQPTITLRYNPQEDHGFGNEIYLTSLFGAHYEKPSITSDYYIHNLPLWMGFYGLYNYLLKSHADKGLFTHTMFVVKSSAIKPITQATQQTYYPLIDRDFMEGKLPFDEYLSDNEKLRWYPTAEKQTTTVNNIIQCGPFIPKLANITNSTWELNYKYQFFFKWGGPQTTDPPVEDPETRHKYPVPDTLKHTLEITDPEKLIPQSILHAWDFRRGLVTQTALKRMSENIPIDSSFESDDSEPQKKKKRVTKELPCAKEDQQEIQNCLLSLCEESTCQETEDLQQFIQQQQQQQRQLKRNILKLLTYLKRGQTQIQMQTGLLE
nr:MAG: ORF1 [Torque teno midi virus]